MQTEGLSHALLEGSEVSDEQHEHACEEGDLHTASASTTAASTQASDEGGDGEGKPKMNFWRKVSQAASAFGKATASVAHSAQVRHPTRSQRPPACPCACACDAAFDHLHGFMVRLKCMHARQSALACIQDSLAVHARISISRLGLPPRLRPVLA